MVMGGFRDQRWRRVGLGLCKVGGVGSRSKRTPWILCSAVRTISTRLERVCCSCRRQRAMSSLILYSHMPLENDMSKNLGYFAR